jgi:hypothetical protein
MSIVDKSRSEIIDELIEYEMGILRQMSLDDFDDWVKSCMHYGLQGYDELSDVELAGMYSALVDEQDKQIAEGGNDEK